MFDAVNICLYSPAGLGFGYDVIFLENIRNLAQNMTNQIRIFF